MTDDTVFDVLENDLDARRGMGKPARFWLRDDDAVEPSTPLDRLLGLGAEYGVPLTLAVIPAQTGNTLVDRLVTAPDVAVAVHGWSHTNHAGADEKSQELGAHRPAKAVAQDLANGFAHLSRLYPGQFVPMLVPPWNRIAPQVVARLPDLGFRACSVFGPEASGPVRMINTHVDVIDWKGTRGGRPADVLAGEIVDCLARSDAPVGILTHHLVHDAAVWAFLERLFALTSQDANCRWLSAQELMSDAPA